MSNGWMDNQAAVGFKRIGRGCKISTGAVFIGPENVELGDNVRIDTGVLVLAGGPGAYLKVGSHVHIAARAVLMCSGGIELGNFSTVGIMSKLISASDNFTGDWLIGPCFSDPVIAGVDDYSKVSKTPIVLEDHAIVTTDCTVLPGVRMTQGSVLGAMALLKRETEAWAIYAGIPAKKVLMRSSRKAIFLGDQWEKAWTRGR